ncbi:MAG: acylhydrolase [Flavobacteriaceae bacterium]|nr:acylhydrolase [Flavobacteriaceae bacterium]
MKCFKYVMLIIFFSFINQVANAQDWANLKKFKKENYEIMNSSVKKDYIVFMGNSITEGWLAYHPEFFEENPYINRGIGGQTTSQMVLRFKQDVIDLKPSVVVILAGINDIAQNTGPISIEMIAENIKYMAESAKANQIQVVLCSVLPAIDFSWRPGLEPAEKVMHLNRLINNYAKNNHIVYVDYFSAMVDTSNGLKKELGTDMVHPNKNGYLVMEPLVREGIKKALNQN